MQKTVFQNYTNRKQKAFQINERLFVIKLI